MNTKAIIQKEEEMKPCPFCGGKAELITRGNDYTKTRSAEIRCGNCYTEQRTGAIHNNLEWCKGNTIKKWNRRTSELSLLQEQGDIDTPLKNMTKNAFTMTDKIEEQGEEKEPIKEFEFLNHFLTFVSDKDIQTMSKREIINNYLSSKDSIRLSEFVTPSGKELREDTGILFDFQKYYYKERGYLINPEDIDNYLKSN